MRIARTAAMTVLLLSGSVAAAECVTIDGLAGRIEPGRIFALGEMHGTEQSPAFAGSVACAVAAQGLELVVGLELASSSQPLVDRYLDSSGAPEDRDALLRDTMWTRSYQDGRNSRAMVALIERVRLLKKDGAAARALFFDAPGSSGGQARDAAMAGHIAASARAHPEAVHVILTGNLHSRTTVGNRWNPDYEPMGYLIGKQLEEQDRIVALDVGHEGGSAWICNPGGCGVVELAARHAGSPWSIEIDDSTRPSGHAGWYHVGTLSASVPALGDHAALEESPSPVEPEPAIVVKKQRKTEKVGSPAVDRLQGRWQAYQNGLRSWTMTIDGRAFHAVVGTDDWYRGEIFVRPGEDLSEIDFLIEDCVCGYKGESSDAIYRWEGERVRLGTPMPGNPRPTFFNEQKGEVVQLRKIDD